MRNNELYKIDIRETSSYLSKMNETKMFLIGLILGIVISVVTQILLLPLSYQPQIGQNTTLITISYGNYILTENTPLNNFVFFVFLMFLIIIFLTWNYIIRKIYGIPQIVEISRPHNKKPKVLAEELKERLKKIIELNGLDYKVKSKLLNGNYFVFLYNGEDDEEIEESDVYNSDFIIEIRKGSVTYKWKPKENILGLINQWCG
jgi:hypothetical protein